MSEPIDARARAEQRLDAFPYRHRLADVMVAPVTTRPDITLSDAARLMLQQRIGSILIEDMAGGIAGIVTEHDAMRALAERPGEAATTPVRAVMSAPLATLPADAFVHRAIARMGRLGIRHLGVTDDQGRVAGIVSARIILRRRVGEGLALGDAIDVAGDAAALGRARAELPALARHLLSEGLAATEVAALLSGALRDITARAAELATAETTRQRGPAPGRWCVMVLGSGGRGESLLAADQDNAIIHEGGDDAWYAAAGQAMADCLDQAGIPYCTGGVMAARPGWRGTAGEWRQRVAGWIGEPRGEALLNVDIFYDGRAAFGAADLAAALRVDALAAARGAPMFLRLLAEQASQHGAALTAFGRFRLRDGRADLKAGGLLPLVGAARAMALAHGVSATDTAERLRAVAALGRLSAEDLERLLEARAVLTDAMLRQQLADIEADRTPSSKVDPQILERPQRARLKEALSSIRLIPDMLRGALTGA